MKDLDAMSGLLAVRLGAVRAVPSGVGDLARFRDSWPERSVELHAAVDGLGVAETAAAREFAVVRAKVAAPGLPTPPRAAPGLRARLRRADAMARRRQWARVAADCAELDEAVTAARRRADELHAAATALLRRRDELRGGLEAYVAHAAAAGLSSGHERAARLLDTAPCDLRASARAVEAYRSALAARLGKR
ncbi:hypothetical protein [Dactylosporangium sp. CS-033363]|uniref:hypothetical protein n=1 Tax=Dactylosporangium sp. CS-033363 TaxID=3239935 RepID=UPI003D8DC4E7